MGANSARLSRTCGVMSARAPPFLPLFFPLFQTKKLFHSLAFLGLGVVVAW